MLVPGLALRLANQKVISLKHYQLDYQADQSTAVQAKACGVVSDELCQVCLQFADRAINILLNIILGKSIDSVVILYYVDHYDLIIRCTCSGNEGFLHWFIYKPTATAFLHMSHMKSNTCNATTVGWLLLTATLLTTNLAYSMATVQLVCSSNDTYLDCSLPGVNSPLELDWWIRHVD